MEEADNSSIYDYWLACISSRVGSTAIQHNRYYWWCETAALDYIFMVICIVIQYMVICLTICGNRPNQMCPRALYYNGAIFIRNNNCDDFPTTYNRVYNNQ